MGYVYNIYTGYNADENRTVTAANVSLDFALGTIEEIMQTFNTKSDIAITITRKEATCEDEFSGIPLGQEEKDYIRSEAPDAGRIPEDLGSEATEDEDSVKEE